MTRRKVTVYHILSVALLLGSALVGAFVLRNSYIRLIEAGRDFGTSIALYVCTMLGIENTIVPTVANVSSLDFSSIIAFDVSKFMSVLSSFGKLFISETNILGYLRLLLGNVDKVLMLFVIAVNIFLVFLIFIKVKSGSTNNKYNKDTYILKLFRKITAVTYVPLKRFVADYILFLRAYKAYIYLFSVLWLMNTNVVPLLLEFLAYVFYFVVSFDVVKIYVQVYKLLFDISLMLKSMPAFVWIVIAAVFFDLRRKNIGYDKLTHLEMRNRGVINALPLCLLISGTIGTGKTSLLADMALSVSIMFRDKAYELLLKNDLRFPDFPWIKFERALSAAIERHEVFTLATCKAWVCSYRKRFMESPLPENVFEYDFERYGLTYNDGLKIHDIFSVLTAYAQEFFIFCVDSALIISNFSIRCDDELVSLGNFPRRNSELFRRNPAMQAAHSRYAKILDFNAMRLGVLVNNDTTNADYLEFGVIAISEVGKECGNAVENKVFDKKSDESNPLNDGFNKRVKMSRHCATVDNYPFIKIIMDEQRAMSLGADGRELCVIINIDKKHEEALAMPCFLFGEWLYELMSKRFIPHYQDYRFRRGDNSLFMYLYKKLYTAVYKHYERITNTFGYIPLTISTESGVMDGVRNEYTYYLLKKKIYSDRFSTDAFAGFFRKKALRSKVGLADQKSYSGRVAKFSELDMQHSHFINDISPIFKLKDTKNERKEITDETVKVKKNGHTKRNNRA